METGRLFLPTRSDAVEGLPVPLKVSLGIDYLLSSQFLDLNPTTILGAPPADTGPSSGLHIHVTSKHKVVEPAYRALVVRANKSHILHLDTPLFQRFVVVPKFSLSIQFICEISARIRPKLVLRVHIDLRDRNSHIDLHDRIFVVSVRHLVQNTRPLLLTMSLNMVSPAFFRRLKNRLPQMDDPANRQPIYAKGSTRRPVPAYRRFLQARGYSPCTSDGRVYPRSILAASPNILVVPSAKTIQCRKSLMTNQPR